MSRIPLHKMLLANLAQKIPRGRRGYMTRGEVYEELKQLTLQDFGYDIEAWERWFADKPLDEAMWGKLKPQTEKERHVSLIKRLKDSLLIDALRQRPKESLLITMWKVTQEEALEELKLRTGQDFGYDAEAWEKWYQQRH